MSGLFIAAASSVECRRDADMFDLMRRRRGRVCFVTRGGLLMLWVLACMCREPRIATSAIAPKRRGRGRDRGPRLRKRRVGSEGNLAQWAAYARLEVMIKGARDKKRGLEMLSRHKIEFFAGGGSGRG